MLSTLVNGLIFMSLLFPFDTPQSGEGLRDCTTDDLAKYNVSCGEIAYVSKAEDGFIQFNIINTPDSQFARLFFEGGIDTFSEEAGDPDVFEFEGENVYVWEAPEADGGYALLYLKNNTVYISFFYSSTKNSEEVVDDMINTFLKDGEVPDLPDGWIVYEKEDDNGSLSL